MKIFGYLLAAGLCILLISVAWEATEGVLMFTRVIQPDAPSHVPLFGALISIWMIAIGGIGIIVGNEYGKA